MRSKRRPIQFWPFYRKTHFDDETKAQVEEVWKMMDEAYNPRNDPESDYYGGHTRSENRKPVKMDYGNTKYALVEKPAYLKGRERMFARGANLIELDYVVLKLLQGGRLPSGAHPHKLKGDKKGLMECHIGGRNSNWVLVYQYDDRELVLYAINTGTHKECGVD